jgi:hypothetical protein
VARVICTGFAAAALASMLCEVLNNHNGIWAVVGKAHGYACSHLKSGSFFSPTILFYLILCVFAIVFAIF